MIAKFRTTLLFIFSLAIGVPSYAQYPFSYLEPYYNKEFSNFGASLHLGTGLYGGTFSDPYEFAKQNGGFNPTVGLGLQYRVTNYITLRGEVNYYTLRSQTPSHFADRSTGFRGNNFEAVGTLAHNVIPKYKNDNGTTNWNAHIFLGGGLTQFTVKDQVTGEDLETNFNYNRGQVRYANLAQVYVFGAGVTYYFAPNLSISGEAGLRYTSTFFLDGIRANTPGEGRDTYFLNQIKLTYSPARTKAWRYNYQRHLRRSHRARWK